MRIYRLQQILCFSYWKWNSASSDASLPSSGEVFWSGLSLLLMISRSHRNENKALLSKKLGNPSCTVGTESLLFRAIMERAIAHQPVWFLLSFLPPSSSLCWAAGFLPAFYVATFSHGETCSNIPGQFQESTEQHRHSKISNGRFSDAVEHNRSSGKKRKKGTSLSLFLVFCIYYLSPSSQHLY